MKKLTLLILCIALGLTIAAIAGAEGPVPDELRGEWIVQEMTDEDGNDAMRDIRSFEGSVRMSFTADQRITLVNALGIENEKTEAVTASPDGYLTTESGLMIAWSMNTERSAVAITDSTGVRILAFRPWTEWGFTEIPVYPEIPVYRNAALEGDWTLIDLMLGKEEQYAIAEILFDGRPYAAQAGIHGSSFRYDNRLTGEQIESDSCEITPTEILVKDENGRTTARFQYELDGDSLRLTKDEDTVIYARENSESARIAYEKLNEIALTGYYEYGFANGELRIDQYHGKAEAVAIPDELDGYPVRYISTDALSGCPQITELKLPGSLANIGGQQLPNLRRITVGEGNESLKTADGILFTADGKRLILYPAADERRNYRIPEGVREIAAYAFKNAGHLTEIVFPDYIESIGESAFADCTGLTEITLPAELQRLGTNAFARCTSLWKAVIMYTDVNTLSDKAFDGCNALTEIHTAANTPAESIYRNAGRNVITDMPAYVWKKDDDGTLRVTGSGILPVFNFSSEPWAGRREAGKPVVLYGRTDETGDWELILSDNRGVLSGKQDLRDYANREDMPWSAYRERISAVRMCGTNGNTAWAVDTDGLLTLSGEGRMALFTEDDGPDNVRYVHPWDKWTVTKAVIGDGLTSVSSGILQGSSVREVTITSGVTTIGREAFYYCRNLQRVELPEGLTTIERYAFAVCESLEQINIPGSVTEIEEYAFYMCSNLKAITLPEGLRELGNSAFSGCYSLKEVLIPDSVTTIGYGVFQSCPLLENVRLPRGMNEIPAGMFSGCHSLREIIIPETATLIGDSAFSGCASLQTIYIPAGVAWIGDNVFSQCTSLSGIRCEAGSYAENWIRMNGMTPLNANGEPIVIETETAASPAEPTGTETETAGPAAEPIVEIRIGGKLPKDHYLNQVNEDVQVGFSILLRADGYALLSESMPEGGWDFRGNWKPVNGGIAVSFESGNGIGDRISIDSAGNATVSFYGNTIPVSMPKNAMDFFAQTGFLQTGNEDQTQQATTGSSDPGTTEPTITVTPVTPVDTGTTQQPVAQTPAELTRPVPGSDTQVYSVVRTANASASITSGKDPTSYLPDKMIDGIDETSWQFSTKDPNSQLNSACAYFEFNGPTIIDEFWIKNGFWKITNNKDQYTQNCRVKELEISFRYEGSNEYTDARRITLKDDQSAKKRKDWAKISIGRHENVTGIRLRIISVYKGAKYKNDVCISEVLFVQNK
uniref:Ig domain-containing protein group 2 domain-containing protein n=1 Tax=uncultured bacterium Contigcl_1523 TaxID=1393648 RepID=W0FS67_9BACT|nr:Ig domain-containing protein group 2 domain-containing protein [uncultured bacterium Contigcl_1523]